jgi:hypothetical protein
VQELRLRRRRQVSGQLQRAGTARRRRVDHEIDVAARPRIGL